ncbi:D-2-hydroxyacid dehydrogenase [Bacteroidota bacterium]
MLIVFLDSMTVGEVPNINKFEDFGILNLFPVTLKEEVVERTSNADIIITNKVVIDKKVMDQANRLKLICIAATGTNNVDLEYAKEKGIEVKNVSGYSTESVTQSTFSMLFYLMNKTRYYDDYVKSGEYTHSPIFTHMGPAPGELSGKQFGIIGLGNIGTSVAKVAESFGAKVLYFSTTGKNVSKHYTRMDLDDLLESSDVISIHAPLTDVTYDLINYPKLKIMKPSAILINTGRGGIVNEKDLADALDEELIAGAALDVFEVEPMISENPLLRIRNKDRLLILPHIAWASVESRTILIDMVYDNIKTFLDKVH